MAIDLLVNGYFEMNISHIDTNEEVSKKEEKVILGKLQDGELFIGIGSRKIVSSQDLLTPLYSFSLEANSGSEYEFEAMGE